MDTISPAQAQFSYASGQYDPRPLFKKELTLFMDSILRSDRSVVDLLTADHTYVNEELALLYGMENVKGGEFRRVTLKDPKRYGLLGKGAVLMAIGKLLLWTDLIFLSFVYSGIKGGSYLYVYWTLLQGAVGLTLLIVGWIQRGPLTE